jgi:hypothetical protein
MFNCKWRPFRCWGDKFLGKYENERYIVLCIGRLGFQWQLRTIKDANDYKIGGCIGWSSLGLYSRAMLYKWEFKKIIFWENVKKKIENRG